MAGNSGRNTEESLCLLSSRDTGNDRDIFSVQCSARASKPAEREESPKSPRVIVFGACTRETVHPAR